MIYEDWRQCVPKDTGYISRYFLFISDWFQTRIRNLSIIYNYFLLTYHYNDLEKSLAAWSNMRCKIFKKGCNLNSIRKREIALRWFRDVFKIYELKMRSTLNLFQMHILKEYTEMLCRFLNQELISNRWYMFILRIYKCQIYKCGKRMH